MATGRLLGTLKQGSYIANGYAIVDCSAMRQHGKDKAMSQSLKASLTIAVVACECSNWHAADVFLRRALGHANREHNSTAKSIVMRALSRVRKLKG